ncbi:hypothetical protein PCL_03436 [Purpureocillium lilacinum]|uniref:Uncharacterized protein n=1 Tax=Purpureocillium lilacinum TaxID=33203 RepID=A0A2U3EP25_PURLI|nr:hypothetical protein Purlil1_4965 [Purpureocillium lilacinum]PWI76242.1 hypothetical protein PCL_03436 [Purpureocillium lilacinum]
MRLRKSRSALGEGSYILRGSAGRPRPSFTTGSRAQPATADGAAICVALKMGITCGHGGRSYCGGHITDQPTTAKATRSAGKVASWTPGRRAMRAGTATVDGVRGRQVHDGTETRDRVQKCQAVKEGGGASEDESRTHDRGGRCAVVSYNNFEAGPGEPGRHCAEKGHRSAAPIGPIGVAASAGFRDGRGPANGALLVVIHQLRGAATEEKRNMNLTVSTRASVIGVRGSIHPVPPLPSAAAAAASHRSIHPHSSLVIQPISAVRRLEAASHSLQRRQTST